MKVSLIHGPAKSGKTKSIIKRFADEYAAKNPVIIVPSAETVRSVKSRIFSETDLSGFSGHRVITFDHMVNLVMEGCSEITGIGKYLLLRKIIGKTDLKYFYRVKNYTGFYVLLARFISEIKTGEILPEIFLAGIKKKGASDKDKEIYSIYSLYQEELHKQNIYDHEGKFWKAQHLLEEGKLGPFADCKIIFIDGFQNFSPTELKIIKSLSKYTDEIIITLTSSFPLLSANKKGLWDGPSAKTYNSLKETFKNITESCMEGRKTQPEKIAITSCPGQVREIEEIAKQIKHMVIHENRKPDDIAVLFRDLTDYKELIVEIFDKYGIPFVISDNISLLKHPPIRALLRKLESVTSVPQSAHFNEYSAILKKLASGPAESYLNLFEVIDNSTQFFENKITFSEFYDSLVYMAECTTPPPDTYKGGQVQILDVHRARGLNFPIVFIGGLVEKVFPKQISEEPLYSDTERAELRKFGVNIEETKEKQKEELFLFYSAISTATENLYLTYSSTDSEGREELASYYIDEIIKTFPGLITKRKIHLSHVVPEIGDAYTYEDLISRILQTPHPCSARPLPKGERKIFFPLSPIGGEGWGEGNNTFVELLYEKLNIANLSEIAAIENNRAEQWNGIITDDKALSEIKNTYNKDYKFSVSQFNEYGVCPFSYFTKRILRLGPLLEVDDELKPNEEGIVYHAILKDYYEERKNSKVNMGNTTLSQEETDKLKIIAEKNYKSAEDSGLIKNKSLWKIKKEQIVNNIINLVQYELNEPPSLGIKRIPSYFEMPFGKDNQEPLIINGVKIQGIIDRIDIAESGLFAIIDYKTGNKPIYASDILKGTNIQLPVYVMAVKDALNIGTDCIEAYLIYVKRKKHFHASPITHYKKSGKKLVFNPSWDEYMDAAKKYVIKYAGNIREGKFPAEPGYECPTYCEYGDICRHTTIKKQQ